MGIETLFSADFDNGAYIINDASVSLGDATDYTRSGTAYSDAANGLWSDFATNVERITDKGIRLEAASENMVRNPELSGASAPSTLPTNWSYFSGGSATRSVVSVGTWGDFNDIVIGLSRGASGTASGLTIDFEPNNQIAATQGTTVTISGFIKLANGKGLTNITAVRFRLREYSSAPALLATNTGSDFKASITSSYIRFSYTATMAQATCAFVLPQLELTYGTNTALDVNIGIVMPQVEIGVSLPSSPVDGARAADALVLKLPAISQTHDLLVTFDDDTTQTIEDVPGGNYSVVPANLDRPLVKSIVWRSV